MSAARTANSGGFIERDYSLLPLGTLGETQHREWKNNRRLRKRDTPTCHFR
jgi:hypothetical protein